MVPRCKRCNVGAGFWSVGDSRSVYWFEMSSATVVEIVESQMFGML